VPAVEEIGVTADDGDALTNRRGQPLRVLVVGASSGIGATTATVAAGAGARVVGAARRFDRVAELAGVTPVACDVRSVAECDGAVGWAAQTLGGLDALVYATGITGLTPLDSAGPEIWMEIFATNLFGAAMVTRAALPHLRAEGSDGRTVFLSSDSGVKPYPGLVAYGASKSALSAFSQGLASEFPDLLVTEVVVGPTIDTEAADHFDTDQFGAWFERWTNEGFIRYGYQASADVAAVIVDTLRSERPDPLVMAAADPP
jgi:NAD(P)-dependent dehydrogenase (short-subunit alcohol dehydrogenase family)